MIPGLRKAFKVRVEIKFRAVSCPGVHLPAKKDIYLSAFVTGQYHQSECLPAVFPLLFQEKMTFEKVFRYAFDPGDVAVMLEHETIRMELVQLIPPAGNLLASFEENTRNFLFPEPKLVRPFSGVDREALMMRAPYFPGIAPRLEFSIKTSISQCLPDSEITIYPNFLMRPAIHRKKCHSRKLASPERKHPLTHRGRRARSADPQRPCTARPQSLSPLRCRTSSQRFSSDTAASCPSDWKTNTSQPVINTLEKQQTIAGELLAKNTVLEQPMQNKCHKTILVLYNCSSLQTLTTVTPNPSPLLWPNRKTTGSHGVWEEVHECVQEPLQNLCANLSMELLSPRLTRF